MTSKERSTAKNVGRWGLSGCGVTFEIIGAFIIQAAYRSNSDKIQGLDAVLSTLANQPYGQFLLGIAVLGFVSYGLYCFSRPKNRQFNVG